MGQTGETPAAECSMRTIEQGTSPDPARTPMTPQTWPVCRWPDPKPFLPALYRPKGLVGHMIQIDTEPSILVPIRQERVVLSLGEERVARTLVHQLTCTDLREPQGHDTVGLTLRLSAWWFRFPRGQLFHQRLHPFPAGAGRETDEVTSGLVSIEQCRHGRDSEVRVPLVVSGEVFTEQTSSTGEELPQGFRLGDHHVHGVLLDTPLIHPVLDRELHDLVEDILGLQATSRPNVHDPPNSSRTIDRQNDGCRVTCDSRVKASHDIAPIHTVLAMANGSSLHRACCTHPINTADHSLLIEDGVINHVFLLIDEGPVSGTHRRPSLRQGGSIPHRVQAILVGFHSVPGCERDRLSIRSWPERDPVLLVLGILKNGWLTEVGPGRVFIIVVLVLHDLGVQILGRETRPHQKHLTRW